MPSALARKVLEEVEKNPKIQILHTHTGTKAFGFLYSKLLRKNKIIVYTLIIEDSVISQRFSYEKGYTLYNEAVDKN
jgi:hypothetical protein